MLVMWLSPPRSNDGTKSDLRMADATHTLYHTELFSLHVCEEMHMRHL